MIQAQLSYYWIWYVIEIMGTSLIFSGVLFGIYQIRFSLLKIALTSIAFSLCGIVQYELTQIIALRWGIGGCAYIRVLWHRYFLIKYHKFIGFCLANNTMDLANKTYYFLAD